MAKLLRWLLLAMCNFKMAKNATTFFQMIEIALTDRTGDSTHFRLEGGGILPLGAARKFLGMLQG